MKKREPKGFTVTEMMVAMAVMSVILLITITFFRFQSQISGTSTRDRSGRQGVTLALTALQRDILQAGYGVARYPQLAFMFGDGWNVNTTHTIQSRSDPRFNLPAYGTLWINYGQYLKSTIPTIPGSTPAQQYAKWPSLVYNLLPLTNTDLTGGTFYIPAADNPAQYPVAPEANANTNNIGAIIVWPNAPTGSEANRSATPVTQPVNPATATAQVAVGQTNKNPPSGIVTQFQVASPPGGLFWFAPAVVYNFVPANPNATPPTLGIITRNQDPNQPLVQSTFLGDRSLAIVDFQIRALYSSGAVQVWMPDAGTLPTGISSSNLRYVETKIVYRILDPSANPQDQMADIQAGDINSVIRTTRVTPRTVVSILVLKPPGRSNQCETIKDFQLCWFCYC